MSLTPELLIRLSNEGKLHQEDTTPEHIKANEILQRIILPHIRGYARIEGSNFDARDFIGTESTGKEKAVNNREEFQKLLLEKVRDRLCYVAVGILDCGECSLPSAECRNDFDARLT